jgi:hypothetical protein
MNKINKTCPKCGYDDTVMEYFPIGDRKYAEDKELFKDFGQEFNKDPQYTHVTVLILDKECIKLHCRTCHYEWVVSVMDSKDPMDAYGFRNLTPEEIEAIKQEIEIPKRGFISEPGIMLFQGL